MSEITLNKVKALAAWWEEALEEGCPACGKYAGDGCDHVEGYHHALHGLRMALGAVTA